MTDPLTLRGATTRQLADVLLALAGAVQRLRMRALPAGDGGAASAVAVLERILHTVLSGRDRLTVEVGTVQLLVDGMETNPDFEPLRDLTLQLRDAGVGAIDFLPGVDAAELTLVLSALVDSAHGSWPAASNLVLRPLLATASPDRDPWLTLERLLLDDDGREVAQRDPREIAFALELHPASAAWDERVLERLVAVARSAATEPSERDALIELLLRLPAATLRRLLRPSAASPTQLAFVQETAGLVPPRVVLRLLQALAPGREAQLTAPALAVLARLARRAEHPGHLAARRALTEELRRLAAGLPDDLASPAAPRLTPEPERVLKLALESGIIERGTLIAADRMIARRQVSPLLALLETVPREDPVARALRGRVFHPQTVRVLLESSPVDLDALDRIIPAAGIEAAPALLDALAESRERRVRLRLLDLLARYGNAIGPVATDRMDGMPWYFQRNVLSLLGRLPDLPPEFAPVRMIGHRDPRVRHEAIALTIADPELRERGLADALDSGYVPTLRLALTALAERCPPDFVPRLIGRVADPALDPELRALAVTALSQVNDPVVLRMLRRLVMTRGIAGLGRLAPKSPTMLAALRGLATHWHSHPKVGPLLETARQSREPEVKEAARLPGRRSAPTLSRPVP
jgi:hypothetical protein